MIDRLLLYLALAGCALFAAILVIEVMAPSPHADLAAGLAAHRAAPTASSVRPQPLPQLDTLVATALARPLFNATRRPAPMDGDDKVVDDDLTNMRLTGIVTEPGGRFAIFAVTGGKPLAIREGEAVSDWRIQSIEPDEVSLTGPGGTKTLHPKSDTSLTRPFPRLRSRRRMAERPAHPAGAADLLRRRAMRRTGAGPRR